MKNAVILKNVTKKYGKFKLGEINLSIPCGFSTALIGTNGAGKTTLLDVICKINGKSGGEITYFDEYNDADDPSVRNAIGYCSASELFPQEWNTAKIAKIMDLAFDNFSKERFTQLCTSMGLDTPDTKIQKKLSLMSDGNKMKTYLAATMARDTRMLILDEPASPLDPLMRDTLCDMFREYLAQRDGERSILFSTHNIADMEAVTDYAVIMAHGQIIETGFVEDLKEKYRIVNGPSEDEQAAAKYLISHTTNRTIYEGLTLTENSSVLESQCAAVEIPTLQQICVGLLRKAENQF